MQADKLSFITKILALSALISVGIKVGGPQLQLPATSSVALGLVLMPTVLLALALGVQYRLQHR